MERVQGIGGIFWKARDPEAQKAWYAAHLGVELEPAGHAMFKWRPNDPAGDACTVWSLFPEDTRYFDPGTASFMINYRVRNLDAMLAQLAAAGISPLSREDGEYGNFAWVLDPEGNKIELWEPPAPRP